MIRAGPTKMPGPALMTREPGENLKQPQSYHPYDELQSAEIASAAYLTDPAPLKRRLFDNPHNWPNWSHLWRGDTACL